MSAARFLGHGLLLLLGLGAPLRAGDAPPPLPGVPSVEQVMKNMLGQPMEMRREARQWIYLLSDADLDTLKTFFKDHGCFPEDDAVLDRVRMLRGDAPTLERYAALLIHCGDQQPLALQGMSTLELAPLVAKLAAAIQQVPAGRLQPGCWIQLAVASREPVLLQQVANLLLQHRLYNVRLKASVFLPAFAPLLRAHPEAQATLLGAVAPGFDEPPTQEVLDLARSVDVQVRERIAQLLSGSTAPRALELAQALCLDRERQVAQAAAMAVLNFRPAPPDAAVLRLATTASIDAYVRSQAWQLLGRGAQFPINVAHDEALAAAEPMQLRSDLCMLLARLGDGDWLLAHWSRLDALAQQGVAMALVEHFTPKLQSVLERSLTDARTMDMLLPIIARSPDPRAISWVIERLKDERPELRAAASRSLEAATGLSGPHEAGLQEPARFATQSAFQQQPAPGPDAAACAQRWRTWWERYRAPLAPEEQMLERDLRGESESWRISERLAALPLPLALRLSCTVSAAVGLRWLAQRKEAVPDDVLLGLWDDIQFSRRGTEVAQAIQAHGADAALVKGLLARLGQPPARSAKRAAPQPGQAAAPDPEAGDAAAVLIAWRVDAAAVALSQAIVGDGLQREQSPALLALLDGWYPPATATLVHALVFAAEPAAAAAEHGDAAARWRALHLYRHHAGAADILDLTRLLRQGPAVAATAADVLTGLALGGSEPAQHQLALALVDEGRGGVVMAAVVDALRPAAARAAEAESQGMRLETPASDQDAEVVVPEAVMAALRHFLGAHGGPFLTAQRHAAARALCLAGDPLSVRGVLGQLAWLDAETLKSVAQDLLASKRRDCLPYALGLAAMPPLDDAVAELLIAWLGKSGQLSAEAASQLRAKRSRAASTPAEANGGDAATLTFAIAWPTAPLVAGQAPLAPVAVTIRNAGSTPVTIEPILFDIGILTMQHQMISGHPELTQPGGKVVLAAGATLHCTIHLSAPRFAMELGSGEEYAVWSADGGSRVVFNGPWHALSVFSPSLAAFDARTH